MILECPNCQIAVSRELQNRMNSFWKGPKPARCENCSKLIQWHSSLHNKLKIGGVLLKIGLALVLISLVPFGLGKVFEGYLLAGIGVSLLLAGVFSTATLPDGVNVELVDET